MTYGQLRLLVSRVIPGVDLDLLEAWIDGRYTQILDLLNWERQRLVSTLELVAPYETGTVALAEGARGVTLSDGTFTAAMTGRAFRATGRNEFYEFTFASGSTGSLDRVYEGETATAAAYKIFQNVYPLPADCRIPVQLLSFERGALGKLGRNELNLSAPGRPSFGTPQSWSPYMDDLSDPPKQQVELYPIPDAARGLELEYFADADISTDLSVSLLPWMRPSALIEGVSADILLHAEKPGLAAYHEKRFEELVKLMVMKDARAKGPQRIRMDSRFTRHRLARHSRGYDRGWGPGQGGPD